jgi:hypothetical protein
MGLLGETVKRARLLPRCAPTRLAQGPPDSHHCGFCCHVVPMAVTAAIRKLFRIIRNPLPVDVHALALVSPLNPPALRALEQRVRKIETWVQAPLKLRVFPCPTQWWERHGKS